MKFRGPGPRSAYGLQYRLTSDGEKPDSQHAAVLFGGDTGIACQRCSDVWTFNLLPHKDGNRTQEDPDSNFSMEENKPMEMWKRMETSGAQPSSRSNCATALTRDKLIVYGGWNDAGTEALADMYILDLQSSIWQKLDLQGTSLPAVGQPGMIPLTDENSVVTFGGWTGSQRNSLLFRVDLDRMAASLIEPKAGGNPPARADHTSCLWRYCDDGVWKDLMVVFGGSTAEGTTNDVWLFDFRWCKWTQAWCGGQGPSPRSSHAAVVNSPTKSMIVLGGQSQGEVYADCYILDLDHLIWHQVSIPGAQPVCRHSLVLHEAQLFMYGGFNGQNTLEATTWIDVTNLLNSKKATAQMLDVGTAGECRTETHTSSAGKSKGPIADDASQAETADSLSQPSKAANALEKASEADQQSHSMGPVEEDGSSASSWLWRPWSMVQKLGQVLSITDGLTQANDNVTTKRGDNNEGQLSEPRTQPENERSCSTCTADKQVHLTARLIPNGTSLALDLLDELPPEDSTKPLELTDLPLEQQTLKGWRLVKAMHETACTRGRDTYIDPASGYSVFTSRYLKRRPCCGNKCRHCPWAYANVQRATLQEW